LLAFKPAVICLGPIVSVPILDFPSIVTVKVDVPGGVVADVVIANVKMKSPD